MAGLVMRLLVWIGFVVTASATNSLFAGRSWRLWAIDNGYHLVGFLLMAAITGIWP